MSFMPQKQFSFIFSLLCLCVLISPISKANIQVELADGEKLNLIGIGMHQELRNDIYLGALFGPPSITNVEQLKSDNVAKRLSLRFMTDYSDRKISRHFKERLAMNNERAKWQPLTREIITFSRIFKQSLQPGDELNIDHVPGVGTQFYLNGTLFETVDKPEFSEILLNVWLGANPPTKAFKDSIRGNDSSATKESYIAKYQSLKSIKGRFDNDLIPEVVSVAKIESIKKADVKVVKKLPTKKEIAKTKPIKNKSTKQTKTIVKKPSPAKKVNLDIAKAVVIPTPLITNTTKTQSQQAIQQPEIEEEDLFDADLVTGSYTRDLINSIRQYEKYPKKAQIRGEEGIVVAMVTIGSQGQIINVDIIERSGSRILDRAVVKMVNKAAPFEAIPEGLKLSQFEFELPIEFKL